MEGEEEGHVNKLHAPWENFPNCLAGYHILLALIRYFGSQSSKRGLNISSGTRVDHVT